jgi:hypothetical protein
MFVLDPSKCPDSYVILGLLAALAVAVGYYALRDHLRRKKNEVKKSD